MRRILNANFHKRRNLGGLRKVTVRQKTGNHTVSFLDYDVPTRNEYLLPPENTPVQVQYGVSPSNVRAEYGYVNHYETTVDSDNKTLVRMVVLGTSKPLNTVNSNSWFSTSRSAIARDIAATHRMRSVVHSHPYVVDTWATGTRTDFQALKALADECGYRMWVDGCTLYFVDPTQIVTTASTMNVRAIPSKDVYNIQVLGGSDIPGLIEPTRRQVQYGLDYRTNEFFTATSGDVTAPNVVNPGSATTFSDAQEVADAQQRKQQDYYVLRATFDGDARLYPGALARVESGRVNNDQGGLWVVSEATHEVTAAAFSTQLTASRGRNQAPLSRTRTTARGHLSQPMAVVRNGLVWESVLQEHVHV